MVNMWDAFQAPGTCEIGEPRTLVDRFLIFFGRQCILIDILIQFNEVNVYS